jgi:hypothetical protein
MPEPERDGQILELKVVRSYEFGSHRTGRPLKLTARCFIRICHLVERGESITNACEIELVTWRTFRNHVLRNPKYQRRLKEAEEIREHFLKEFHIANISKHSVKNVVASMWWLERRYPNEFALRSVIREEVNSAAQEVFGKISLEQLIENARLAKEVAANPPPGLLMAPENGEKEANPITS